MKPATPEQIAAAGVRFAAAYRAAIAAHAALRDHWRRAFPAPDSPEDGPSGGHRYGACQRSDPNGDPTEPLSAVCLASQPLHAARLAARKERGNALRALLRATKATT